jgi:hypothetical protein
MADADLSFDRVTYREGQLLTARDLSDDHGREIRLGRLHVRHLHETWGIAIGFDVQPAGPSAVAVGPGYALDHLGRELVLAASLAIPVPAVPGPETFVLVATFLEDGAFVGRGAGDAVCLDGPLQPRRERPALAWRTPGELERGPMVPLGHVVVQGKAILGSIQTRVRRYARRLVRPQIGTGTTDFEILPGSRWWKQGNLLGFEQRVSTLEADFTSLPLYFAGLVVMQPSVEHSPDEVAQAIAQAQGHIASTATDGFVYRVVVREPFVRDLETTWAVSWIGVQPLAGCPPSLDLKRLLTLAGSFFHVT